MSQMGSFFIPGVFPPGSVVQTLSGNAGVNPVSPDGLNNINVFGDTVTTNVTGDGVNTLTVSVTDNFASTYTTDDANFAVPVAYNLNVFGVDGIATTSAGDTVTIGTDGTLPDTFNADVGSAVPALGIIAFVGAGGITTSAAGSTVTIDGSGIVGGITSITGDTGGAQAGPGITFAGGTTGLAFGGAANTLTTTFAGITANGGAVNLGTDNAANGITIGTGTTGRLINIGQSAAAHTIVMGNTNTTTSMSLQSGTGNTVVNSAGTTTITGTGGVSVNSISGAINIGDGANANAINLGTGAAARTITVGNITGATDLDLRYGTGDFTLASATGTIISALDTGEVTKPLQPAFFAILASADNNVTGAGASYVIGTNVALTEIFDQNADFNTNGTFTAPVTGRYAFYGNVGLNGVTASTFAMRFRIVASNRRYDFYLVSTTISASMTELAGSAFIDMDSGDICQLIINGSGGTDVIDLAGDATEAITSFGGYLVC